VVSMRHTARCNTGKTAFYVFYVFCVFMRCCCICTYSADNRWLLCSCEDRSLYVYDLLSSSLIDWIMFDSAVISMSFVKQGTFLLTTHDLRNEQGNQGQLVAYESRLRYARNTQLRL